MDPYTQGAEADSVILFSVQGQRATEVISRGLEFTDEIPALFTGSKVTKPVPVMVEGTYHIYDPFAKGWKEVTISPDDIQAYKANTHRDVPVNIDHKRGGKAKGWLRLKGDTSYVGQHNTPAGPRTALFASLELFDEAVADVDAGFYRDVSIELKPISREAVGIALTSYPIMRDLQFSQMAAEPAETAPQEEPVDQNQIITDYLAQFGISPEQLGGLIAQQAQTQRQLRVAEARQTVSGFVNGPDGASRLAPGAINAAAELLVFCQENHEQQFSVDGNTFNPQQLLEEIFKGVQAVQLYGAVRDEDDTPVASTQPAEPAPDYDESRSSRIAEMGKRVIARQSFAPVQ